MNTIISHKMQKTTKFQFHLIFEYLAYISSLWEIFKTTTEETAPNYLLKFIDHDLSSEALLVFSKDKFLIIVECYS